MDGSADSSALLTWLAGLRSRGDVKRAAQQVQADGTGRLRQFLCEQIAAQRGCVPEDVEDWPAKKLLRRALDREEGAMVRKNPIARDEAFVCAWCGFEVPQAGRTARDHCPRCLRSLHVDALVPGDRAATCGGVLTPLAIVHLAGAERIAYRCERCGEQRRTRVLVDVDVPDDRQAVRAVSRGEDPWPGSVRRV